MSWDIRETLGGGIQDTKKRRGRKAEKKGHVEKTASKARGSCGGSTKKKAEKRCVGQAFSGELI